MGVKKAHRKIRRLFKTRNLSCYIVQQPINRLRFSLFSVFVFIHNLCVSLCRRDSVVQCSVFFLLPFKGWCTKKAGISARPFFSCQISIISSLLFSFLRGYVFVFMYYTLRLVALVPCIMYYFLIFVFYFLL